MVAVNALARIRHSKSVGPLIKVLKDDVPAVANAAANALAGFTQRSDIKIALAEAKAFWKEKRLRQKNRIAFFKIKSTRYQEPTFYFDKQKRMRNLERSKEYLKQPSWFSRKLGI